jgi:hypothetical protein
VPKAHRILEKAQRTPSGLRFREAQALAQAAGFHLTRVTGSHRIFTHQSLPELLNLQDVRGQAKAYQVRQLLSLIERYNLRIEG